MTIMRTIRPPESKQATTLLVAVRCRPLSVEEQLGKSKDIIRVLDDKVVVVLDPDDSKEYLDRVQNRSKEKKYVFDSAFRPEAKNQDIYKATVAPMVEGVIQGLNATIFAYGATGSGKTHTMVGTSEDPGLMVLSLREIFELVTKEGSDDFEVTCSYLEVYNEVIYDLLEKSSGHLELREDPDQGITAAGLKRIKVNSAEKILELLNLGNSRRKTESTEANATSSRSHAVLEIIVRQSQQNQYHSHVLHGKLALVDLAGSERASETMNAGQKLRDGANINKSLLALANCINALGKQQKKGLAYVPYRNSKLTRILKDGLSGNSRTVMVAAISCGSDQYHHTINTLKYADRAKEIKTHIQKNVGTLDSHIANYQRMIDNLQSELSKLRKELAEKETQLNVRPVEKLQDDELSWLDVLSQDISENVEERINLQKAIFELEDMNLRNRTELQQLDELVVKHQFSEDSRMAESLVERRKVVLDNVRDNDEAGAQYQHEIEINEAQRKELQQVIDEAISSNGNKTYLRILSQYRLLGMTNTELQFQIAVRDQIINNHREAISNLWQLLECSGLDHKQILELAARQGITIEDWIVPSSVTGKACTPPTGSPLLSKPMHSTRARKGMPPFPIIAQQMINTEGFLNRSIDLENLRAVQPESRSPVSRLLLMTGHMMESSPPHPPEVPKGGVEEGGNSSNALCTPSIFESNTAAQSEMAAVDACSSQVSKPSSGEPHIVRTAAYNCNSDQTFQKDSNNNNNNNNNSNNNKHPHVIHTFQDPSSLKNNGGLVKATTRHLFSNGLGIHCQSPRLENITLEALEAPLGSRTKYV